MAGSSILTGGTAVCNMKQIYICVQLDYLTQFLELAPISIAKKLHDKRSRKITVVYTEIRIPALFTLYKSGTDSVRQDYRLQKWTCFGPLVAACSVSQMCTHTHLWSGSTTLCSDWDRDSEMKKKRTLDTFLRSDRPDYSLQL